MPLHTDLPRWRRALVALVLILGQFAVTAAAAGAQCARERGAAVAVVADAAAAAVSSGAVAEERAPTPDSRLPDGPSAPGPLPCTMLMLARPAAEAPVPAAEHIHDAMAPDETAPKSAANPPPYRPPRG